MGAALAMVAAACGGDDGAVCGEGTTEVAGECVPDATCGAGTTLNSTTGECEPNIGGCATGTTLDNGECVPDGTVICETGTTYDSATGKCVADITGCAAGTVLVSGECVPDDDTLTADVNEPAEPNGFEAGATWGLVTLPAVGDDVVIGGCVGPRGDDDLSDNSDGDLDVFVLEPTGPTLLDITVDGVGGMSGAFWMLGFDPQGRLIADGWQRQARNLVGDTASRQVFMPMAGTYLLIVADGRTFANGQGFGDDTNTCYFTTVANVAIPTPTALGSLSSSVTLTSDSQFVTYDADASDIIEATFTKVGINGVTFGSLVTTLDDEYIGSIAGNTGTDFVNGAQSNAIDPVYVIEPLVAMGLTPVDYTLELDITAPDAALPGNNSVTVAPQTDNYFFFDVAGPSVYQVTMDDNGNGDEFTVELIAQRQTDTGNIFAAADTGDALMKFAGPGRYYLRVTNDNAGAVANATINFTHAERTASSVTQGTPATAVPLFDLGAGSAAVVDMTVANARWLSYTVTPNADVGDGIIGVATPKNTGPIFSGGPVPGPSPALVFDGRANIFSEDTGFDAWIIAFDTDPGAQGGSPAFDIAVDNEDFTDLNAVDEANPVSMTGVSIGADESKFYYFTVGPDTALDATADPDASTDVDLFALTDTGGTADSSETSANDTAEQITGTIDDTGYVALAVTEMNSAAGTFDLSVTAVDPTYSIVGDTANLTNACTAGSYLDLDGFTNGVSPAESIGFSFDFYGQSYTDIYVTDYGWLSFDAVASNESVNNALLPFASDALVLDDICIYKQASAVTVQWRGTINGEIARFQAILRDNDQIQFRYAAGIGITVADAVVDPGLVDDGDTDSLFWRGEIKERSQITLTPK